MNHKDLAKHNTNTSRNTTFAKHKRSYRHLFQNSHTCPKSTPIASAYLCPKRAPDRDQIVPSPKHPTLLRKNTDQTKQRLPDTNEMNQQPTSDLKRKSTEPLAAPKLQKLQETKEEDSTSPPANSIDPGAGTDQTTPDDINMDCSSAQVQPNGPNSPPDESTSDDEHDSNHTEPEETVDAELLWRTLITHLNPSLHFQEVLAIFGPENINLEGSKLAPKSTFGVFQAKTEAAWERMRAKKINPKSFIATPVKNGIRLHTTDLKLALKFSGTIDGVPKQELITNIEFLVEHVLQVKFFENLDQALIVLVATRGVYSDLLAQKTIQLGASLYAISPAIESTADDERTLYCSGIPDINSRALTQVLLLIHPPLQGFEKATVPINPQTNMNRKFAFLEFSTRELAERCIQFRNPGTRIPIIIDGNVLYFDLKKTASTGQRRTREMVPEFRGGRMFNPHQQSPSYSSILASNTYQRLSHPENSAPKIVNTEIATQGSISILQAFSSKLTDMENRLKKDTAETTSNLIAASEKRTAEAASAERAALNSRIDESSRAANQQTTELQQMFMSLMAKLDPQRAPSSPIGHQQ